MRTIFKYPLRVVADKQAHDIPAGTFLSVQNQRGTITLWFEVTPGVPDTRRHFEVVLTGGEVPLGGKYLGTVQEQSGYLVCHIYEVKA